MKVIVPTINRNSQGEAVSNLQDGLLFLLRRQLIRVADEERRFFEEGLIREQQIQRYDDITQKSVGIFQEQNGLQISGEVDGVTAEALNLLFRENGAFNGPEKFVVKGTLSLADNTPAPNITIRAFDRDLRSRELLGQTTTNADGYYEISYTRKQFSRAEKQTADLIVAAVELMPAAVSQYKTLVESPTLYNAPAVAEINLTISATIVQPLSEYARLVQTLDDLLVNMVIAGNDQPTLIDKLADLSDEDLDFLFHETHIELEKLQILTQSARLQQHFAQQDFSVSTPTFYALARTKRLNDLTGFARSSIRELKEGLVQAGGIPNQPQQNIITPFDSEDQLDQIVATLHSVAIADVLNNPLGDNQATLSQVFAIALPSVSHQQALLQTYANHDGSSEQFWDSLRQQDAFQEPGQVEKIQFALQLNSLTQSHLPLVERLQTEFQSTRSMAQMNPDSLITRLKELSPTAPEDFPGDTPEEKLELYTRSIVGLLQGAFPTESVAHVVNTVAEIHFNKVAPTAVSQFLNRASDSNVVATDEVFDIQTTHIDRFVESHGDLIFADITGERTQITQQVKRVQRLFQVSTSPETFKVLMESGFQSANQLAKQPFRTLQANLGQQIANEDLKLMHERAIATSAASLQTALMAYQSATDIYPAAIGGGLKELPNWANLFGSLELCECQHCRSLYSPAAYFVDLLEFLRNAPANSDGLTPLDVLVGDENKPNFVGKRPDLPYIPLTCENTNTPIPYIDLVNEVLESYVAFGQLNATTAKDTGLASAAELSANPQYVEEAAYQKLREAVFPISLPFDRPLEIARLYLDHLGINRYKLMQSFAAEPNTVVGEALGLSEMDFEILSGVNFLGQPTSLLTTQLYTYANEDLTPRLAYNPLQIAANSAVVILQAKLNIDDPDLRLSLTGKYDDLTQAAVIAFQQKFALPDDGIVDADDWAVLDTLQPQAVGALITGVPEFLQRTEVSYVELIDLLKTRFINPNQRLLVAADEFLKNAELTNQDIRILIENNFTNATPELQAKLTKASITLEQIQNLIDPLRSTALVLYAEHSECELDKTLIQYLDGNSMTDADAWKFQRFIRLWRKLAWTIPELDNVLLSLGYPDTVPTDCLLKLSQIKQLQADLNLSLPKLLSFWGNIGTYDEKPLYKALFQNKAVLNPPDPDFGLNDKQDELADTTLALADKQPAILAALRIKASALDAIIADAQLPNARLNLANLSALYRYATLAKALAIPVQELIAIKKLAGDALNPFTTGNPEPTLAFVRLVQAIKSSGFVVPQLDYLLRHQVVLPSKFPPPQKSVEALLKTLRDGLITIANDNQLPLVPDSEVTRNKLGILFASEFVDQIIQLLEGTAVYTQALDELPPGIKFPASIEKKIRYERKVISFTGPMSDDEQSLLVALSEAATYQTAINRLYRQPRDLLSKQDGVTEARALIDFLDLGLAEQELLNKASLNAEGQPLLVDVTGNPSTAENAVKTAINVKHSFFLANFLPYLQDILSRNLIQQTLGQALNLDSAILNRLLTYPNLLQANLGTNQRVLIDFLVLGNQTADQVLPVDTTDTYERLYKIAMLVNTFNLTEAEVEYWFSSDFVGFQLNALPIAATEQAMLFGEWQQLAAYVSLRNGLPQGLSNLIDVFKADDAVKADQLAQLTGWRKTDIEQARAVFGLQNADLLDVHNLLKIQQAIALSQMIGVSVETLKNWSTHPLDMPQAVAQATAIKNAAKAKYTTEAWLEASKPLSDHLRERQKSALISYVLSMPDIRRANVTDSNRLFEYFLIDVEMSACMQTSRIKQAISSVQLFVQRCLLNLEPLVKPSAIAGDRWQWSKNYRVWEANRKVFLYPENWIEPGLRDNKSPFFSELESELLQTDVTNEAAEKALLNYLYKLDQVARLDVCGMYLQEETEGEHKSILHVFARTMGAAVHSYFYRRLLDNKEWTPWEKVELDINGVQGSDKTEEDGIHLLPVVWNRRLYLFWLIFTQKSEQIESSSNVKPQDGISINIPKKYWEIKLAWSKYEQGKWLPKNISTESISRIYSVNDPNFSLFSRSSFKLRANQEAGGLSLDIRRYSTSGESFWGIFYLDASFGNISIKTIYPSLNSQIAPNESTSHFMGYKGQSHLELRVNQKTLVPVLNNTSLFQLRSLNQNYFSSLQSPFFYQDNQNIYFVRSREAYEIIVRQVANPQKTSPFLEKALELQFQGRLSVPKVEGRLEKSVANPWVLAEQQLVVQKLTTFATRSGSANQL